VLLELAPSTRSTRELHHFKIASGDGW